MNDYGKPKGRAEAASGPDSLDRVLAAARPEPSPLPPGRARAVYERAQAFAAAKKARTAPSGWAALAGSAAALTAALLLGMVVPDTRRTLRPAGEPAPRPGENTVQAAAAEIKRPNTPRIAKAVSPVLFVAADSREGHRRRRRVIRRRRVAHLAGITRQPFLPAALPTPPAVIPAPPAVTPAMRLAHAAEPEEGRLVVAVTHPADPPALAVHVRSAAEDEPGYARASAVFDGDSQLVWAQSTFRSGMENPRLVLIGAAGTAPARESVESRDSEEDSDEPNR